MVIKQLIRDKYNELGYGRNDIRRENVGGYPLINATAIKQVDFLPSTSFIYKIKSQKFGETNFRFNYSKTIARPSLRELNDAAEKARDYIMSLPERFRKIAERTSIKAPLEYEFNWITR